MQAMRRPGGLTIQAGLKYGFTLSWIASGVGLLIFVVLDDTSPIRLFLGLFAILIVALPPFLAYAGAVQTVTATRGREFDLLCITPLSDYRLIEGYVLTSLYRFKGFLALLVGFTPLTLLWTAAIAIFDCQFPSFCSAPNLINFFLALCGYIILAINITGICLFNTVIGVLLGTAITSRIVAGFGALIVSLSLTPFYVWAAVGMDELLVHNLIVLPIPYAFSAFLIWQARPLIRKAA
jgi:hypothetical protein